MSISFSWSRAITFKITDILLYYMKCYSVIYYPIITVLCIKGNNRIMYKGKQPYYV